VLTCNTPPVAGARAGDVSATITALPDDAYPLGRPRRAQPAAPVGEDDPSNWEPVPGRPHLWRNKVTGKMKYTPPEPAPEPWQWPFLTP